MMTASRIVRLSAALAMVSMAASCSGGTSSDEPTAVRVGFFANVTHAPALIGVAEGYFVEELGDGARLETATFNAGPEAIEALFAGAIDITYIGPNPAVNGWAQSNGEALRIIAGTTSGGAALVVQPSILTPQDLGGKTLATPQLGNTQDVALRAWLAEQGFSFDETGGGDVSIVPQANAQTLQTFRSDQIDGAWVPEPWATRLVQEGGGHVLVDERDLWPNGQFVTTHVIVRAEFLEQHPDLVEAFLRAHVRAVDFANDHPAEAQADVADQILAITGQELAADVIAAAWGNMTFTVDPIADSLVQSARDAEAVGLLEPVDLTGIYALELLNGVLAAMGREPVFG
ncbi:MAG TPA: ABC transporter substrate-binding protein [Acidimicrobiia bacterium]